jgi:hypothetical protein
MNKKPRSHAEQNAEGHAESILALYRGYTALEEGASEVDIEGYPVTSSDDVTERAQETALSVQVRGDWHAPGAEEGAEAVEFNILLTTGGPALRILGALSEHGYAVPDESKMQHQDWGTPWTDYLPEAANADDWDDAWAWFLGCFYLGE